jgi:hypothetical protein
MGHGRAYILRMSLLYHALTTAVAEDQASIFLRIKTEIHSYFESIRGDSPAMSLIRTLSLDEMRFGDYDNVPVNSTR